MKKAVVVILSCACLLLSILAGCKKLAPDKNLDKSFKGMTGYTAKISVTAENTSYSFDFSRTGNDAYTLKIISPAPIAGITMNKKGDNLTVGYGGLTVPLDFLPSELYNGIDKLTDVLMTIETLVQSLPVTAKNETVIIIHGKANEALSVSMEIDTKSLLPVKVTTKINGSELTAKITEFKILK